MIKQQKKSVIILISAFILLLAAYFALIRPLLSDGETADTENELLDGEVMITDKTSNFYIFKPLERSDIQSINYTNEHGSYRIYRDRSDSFQLEGYTDLPFDSELFSSLIVSAGQPIAMMRVAVDPTEEQLSEYGLTSPRASWTVTSTRGKTQTMKVGDPLLSAGGYYVMLEGRNAVYIVSNTISESLLAPAENLILPLLTYGMTQNDYLFVDEFSVWHGEELFVHILRKPDEEITSENVAVEFTLTSPKPENGDSKYYELNEDFYYEILGSFISLAGDSVVKFRPSDEETAKYGLDKPAYTVTYKFNGQTTYIFVSEKQEDGKFYAVSSLFGYELLCSVPEETLSWLTADRFKWIFPTPFFVNISTVSRIILEGEANADFRFTHGSNPEGIATLEVKDEISGAVIPNRDIYNFREYYKTILNITNQNYAPMSAEDRDKLISDESKVFLTLTYQNISGDRNVYKFYKYYEDSTGKVSTGKVFVTVNGIGEFYTTNDLVDKVIDDTERVIKGLYIDSYQQH